MDSHERALAVNLNFAFQKAAASRRNEAAGSFSATQPTQVYAFEFLSIDHICLSGIQSQYLKTGSFPCKPQNLNMWLALS